MYIWPLSLPLSLQVSVTALPDAGTTIKVLGAAAHLVAGSVKTLLQGNPGELFRGLNQLGGVALDTMKRTYANYYHRQFLLFSRQPMLIRSDARNGVVVENVSI